MARFLLRYLLPLSFGSLLYALCRSSTLLYERIFYLFIGTSWFSLKRSLNYSCRSLFADDFAYKLAVYSLPNALWHISFCYLLSYGITTFWGTKRIVWRFRLLLFFFAAFAPDVLQYLGLIPGTFDAFDILLTSFASVFVWMTT